MRITFEIVSIGSFTHKWKENGKGRQKTKTFSQTLNPWNKNKNGDPKTRQEIYAELYAQKDAWVKRCEEGEGL